MKRKRNKIPFPELSIAITTLLVCFSLLASAQTADEILKKVDANMSSANRIFESSMTIHGKRFNRTLTSKTYSVGADKSFTEYLSPARERGTKMLKLKNQLWIYAPASDRTIEISGHMLRQSVMGSDLSYEDMMEDRKLTDIYTATLVGKEKINERECFVVDLIAKVENTAYYRRKMWIDTKRFVPLKEDLFAKSGQLLKRTRFSQVKYVSKRWFPMFINFKDMLKNGEGTDFNITNIQFNRKIPDYIFTKASLKK
jgi:outer membrane lipoprotein-sorting protein